MQSTKKYCCKVELESGREIMATPWCDTAEQAFNSFDPDRVYEEDVYRVWLSSYDVTDIRPLDESEIKRAKERMEKNNDNS